MSKKTPKHDRHRTIMWGKAQRKYYPNLLAEEKLDQHGPRNREDVKVACWCGKTSVLVPQADVSHGLTKPCLFDECVKMDAEVRGIDTQFFRTYCCNAPVKKKGRAMIIAFCSVCDKKYPNGVDYA